MIGRSRMPMACSRRVSRSSHPKAMLSRSWRGQGALVRGRAEQAQRPVLAQGVVLSEKLRGRTDPSRAFGGIRRATNRLTAPAYWKFESSPLQQTVRLSPDFASVPGKTRGFPPFWRPCGAAESAETRKALQHRAEEG